MLSGALVVGITVVAVLLRSRRPYFAVGWLWYLGTLVPVIGLVQVGDQAWADRYTYLPLIGLFVIFVWGAAEIIRNRRVLATCGAIAAVALLVSTTLQLRYWRNTRTLFEHAAQVVPENYMAITMLGSLSAKDGKLDEAMAQYHRALQLKPGFAEAHFFLGNALENQGKLDEAIVEYRQALWFKPLMGTTHILLGAALAKKGAYDEAVEHYEAAIKIGSESAVAHLNLGRILQLEGKVDAAIEHYRLALDLDPKLAQAHNNLGIALLEEDRVADGAAELRESLRLNPTNTESQFNLALALNREEHWSEAVGCFSNAVASASSDPNAHFQFALALANSGQTRQAMAQYAEALLLRPDFPEALNGLAWIICTTPNSELRNAEQALGMAERACELTGRKDPVILKTLAAAYAEAGRFKEAVTTAQTAQKLATTESRDALTKECGAMVETFKLSQAWRATNGVQ
jgi:tetratricopeptide (TPR) repeat protein